MTVPWTPNSTLIHLTDTWAFLNNSENSWLAETQRVLETDKTKAPEGYGYLQYT